MKSLACFVTGIALIALVVPGAHIQYVMAQSGTFTGHYCLMMQEEHTFPDNISCVEELGQCNSLMSRHYYELGKCIRSTTGSVDCYEFLQIQYRTVPVIQTTRFLTSAELGLTALGAVFCYYVGKVPIVIKGVTVPGLVTAVVCAGVLYTVNVGACDFITCTVDYTGPGVWGPNKTQCYDVNAGS